MGCTDLDASKMDETMLVKGCLGRLPCSFPGKNKGSDKQDNSASSPRTKLVSKPSAVVLPSPRQDSDGTNFEGVATPVRENVHNRQTRHDAIKGQLSLCFHIDGGIIFVQVLDAKNLKLRSSFQTGESFYVAIELDANSEDSHRQTTKAVFSQTPVFNEEFVLRRICPTNSRLLISLYKSDTNGCDEMVGCMSFGVSNLLQKYSSNSASSADTYVLLNRTLGMKKHLRTNQIKHLSLVANMTGVSSLSSEMYQQSSLLRRTIISSRSSELGSDGSTVSSNITSDESTGSSYSNLPSDSMWSYHKAIHGDQHLNSTAMFGTPKKTGDAMDRLTNHFDSCSLSSVSLYELSSCPGQSSFSKFFNMRGARNNTNASSGTSDSNSSLKLADLVSFSDISRTNAESLNQSDSLPVFPSGISREEEVCLQLIHAENKFISLMHQGVLRFSRPLSHGILNSSEHKILFQNVEKLLAISEYHLRQLSDAWKTSTETIQPVGKIYHSQMQTLCESYLTYFRGLSAADDLLTRLLERAPFVHFLNQNPPGVPDIRLDTFLQEPQKHLQNLMFIIDDIVGVVDLQQDDFKPLLDVQKDLTDCWKRCITEDVKEYADDIDEGIYDDLDDMQIENQLFASSGSARGIRSKNVEKNVASQECGINSDLVQLVKCMQLSNKVKPFQLAVPGRHIVFSGEMDFVDNWKWVKAQVFLMNDVIIVTKKQPNNRLWVIAEPIFLKDILNSDFECLHPDEILLTVKTESREHPWSHMRTITFRTSVPGIKVTWQHLLKQRLSTINGPPKTAL